ncbi:hypothetical protein F4678DRAFT_153567 [Xylaria arbuscula]|nr:hypothetical protein F4678DRAFT_153567 [Xylaria arbuscula]
MQRYAVCAVEAGDGAAGCCYRCSEVVSSTVPNSPLHHIVLGWTGTRYRLTGLGHPLSVLCYCSWLWVVGYKQGHHTTVRSRHWVWVFFSGAAELVALSSAATVVWVGGCCRPPRVGDETEGGKESGGGEAKVKDE